MNSLLNAGIGGESREAALDRKREVFSSPGSEGKYLYHYTRLGTAVEAILPSLQLRFSRFSNMRDPRETLWAFAASFWGEDEGFFESLSNAHRRLDELKSSVRLISLTWDRASEDSETDPRFGRGYAHPRLWEQYADDHTGVCLCFSIPELLEAVNRAISGAGGQFSEHGEVMYRDREIGRRASNIDLNAVARVGLDEVLLDLFEVHQHDLFFTKLRDWGSEMEYRFLTYWDDPGELYVDVSSTLKAVVAGHAVRAQYGPTLRALCDPEDIVLARMHWQNGLPLALDFPTRIETRAERLAQLGLSQSGGEL
jgi:hypothetical protein